LQLRTILKDDEPWFVAKDVCDVLEITNITQAVSRLDEDERSMFNIGRQGESNIISESGLFSLILSSRKAEAKQFKKWVTSTVLPSIRRNGYYQLYSKELDILALETEKKVLELNAVIEDLTPKAEFYDKYVSSKDAYLISAVAKIFNIAQKKFFTILNEKKIIFKRDGVWTPYAPYGKYFKFRITGCGYNETITQSRFTGEGIIWLSKKLNQTSSYSI